MHESPPTAPLHLTHRAYGLHKIANTRDLRIVSMGADTGCAAPSARPRIQPGIISALAAEMHWLASA